MQGNRGYRGEISGKEDSGCESGGCYRIVMTPEDLGKAGLEGIGKKWQKAA